MEASMRSISFPMRACTGIALLLAVSACNLPNTAPEKPASPIATQNPFPSPAAINHPTGNQPTATSLPATAQPPTATLALPTATATIAPTGASNTPAEMEVKIFLIAMGDGGHAGPAVGCGDSAVGVIVQVPYTTGVLRAALTALLANHNQYHGESGLYNALYQSRLTVDDVALAAGTATIRLSGTLTMGGECDSPRVEAQLKQTALQFSTVHAVAIFINGHPLSELLSGR
jgi:hypothetical protein